MNKTKGCTGKKKYLTEEAAELAILVMRTSRRRKKIDSKLNSYHCKHCNYWHIGHNRYNMEQL